MLEGGLVENVKRQVIFLINYPAALTLDGPRLQGAADEGRRQASGRNKAQRACVRFLAGGYWSPLNGSLATTKEASAWQAD